jgi:alkylated DNA repair dioxygenase AlkB
MKPRIENALQEKGLTIEPDFITVQEHDDLLNFINSKQWNGRGVEPNAELKRRTMQFGALFRYKTRKIESKVVPLPNQFDFLVSRLSKYSSFNHLVINEYEVGQGIMPHIDSPALFGPVICSLSLMSDCVMRFESEDGELIDVHLPNRSLLVMERESRYKYKHSISKLETEQLGDLVIQRAKRVSITFRLLLEQAGACDNCTGQLSS